MNKLLMMGRLTKDPEIRYTEGQNRTCIASMSIAVDRRFKRDGDPDADFFDCTAFGKTGEFAEKFLKKGTKVVIEGRLQNDNYTNKDGQKVYRTRIYIEAIEFAESKNNSNGTNGQQGGNPAPTGYDGFMNVPSGMEDELPFA